MSTWRFELQSCNSENAKKLYQTRETSRDCNSQLLSWVTILVSRKTNIGTQPENSEMWSLEVSRVWHSFSALSESRLWGSNLRVDAYMHYPDSIFFIKNWIKQINSQKYYSIFSYSIFIFTDFSEFLSLRFRVIEPIYLLSPRKLEDLFNHFPKLHLYFYLRTIFIILYI